MTLVLRRGEFLGALQGVHRSARIVRIPPPGASQP